MTPNYLEFFQAKDYRLSLKNKQTAVYRAFGRQFSIAQIAEAIGIQRTYLSAVLNGRGHLSTDQLFAVAEHLDLDENENKFVEISYQYTRSTLPARRKELKNQMTALLQAMQETKENLPHLDRIVGEGAEAIQMFYLEPALQIIYVFLTIPKYQKKEHLIAEHLNMNRDELQTKLERLVELNLLEKKQRVTSKGFYYKAKDQTLHLEPNNPYCKASQKLMRLKSLEKMDRKTSADYFFSSSFTADKSFQVEFKSRILELLEWAYKRSNEKKHAENHVLHVNLDLFRWDS